MENISLDDILSEPDSNIRYDDLTNVSLEDILKEDDSKREYDFDLELQLDNDDDSSGEEISKILKEAESKLNETLKITQQKPSVSINASTQKVEVKAASNRQLNVGPSDAPAAIEEKDAEPIEELQTILKNVNLDEYKNDQGTDIDSLMRTLLISGDSDVSGVAAIEAAEKKNLSLVKQSKEILKTIEERRRKKELNSNILTLNFLEQISDQLKNNKMKRAAGIPTCMVVNKLIAVGTSLGFVLLFDHFQNLLMILGTREGVEYGTVTSMDISHEGDRLAVGHQRGQIVYWDLIKKKSLKAITGIHKTPVIHVRFVNENGIVLSADSSGVIYFTIFRKVAVVGYIVADPVLVLGGAGGVIKDLKVLPKSSLDNKINNYKLAAFCTGDIVTIVSCMNGGVKIARQIQGPDGSTKADTPLIAWKKLSLKTKLRKHDKDKVKPATDPILAVAWNSTLRLLQISLKPKLLENPMLDLEITNLIDHPMGFQIKAMEWLGGHTLTILNDNDELILFDPFTLETLELRNLSDAGILFHTKYLLGESGAEDQKMLKKLPQVSHQNALSVHQGRFYIAGVNKVYGGHILSWSDRINAFVTEGRWIEAIALALDFFQGKAQAVAGLPSDLQSIHQSVGAKVEEILYQYVSVSLQKKTDDPQHYQTVAIIAIDCCINTEKTDFLYDKLFPLFTRARQEAVFIKKLEPFILGGKLSKIPPDLIQKMIDLYMSTYQLQIVEQIILHLDLASLDFHQVVTLSRKHYLSSVLFYIFIHGMGEYIMPLDDHIKILLDTNKFTTPEQQKVLKTVGAKILLYLSYCFRGHTYPLDKKIPEARAKRLVEQIYSYLFAPKVPPYLNPYPRVTALLKFNTEEFMRILGISFDAQSSSRRLTELSEILINLMFNQNNLNESSFTEKQQGYFLLFLAKYVSRKMVNMDTQTSKILLSYLIESKDSSTAAARENALLELVKANQQNTKIGDYDYDYILSQSINVNFHKVSEWFFMQRREYTKVIQCRLADHDYRKSVFDFIKVLLTENIEKLSDQEIAEIKAFILERLRGLLDIDSILAVEIILRFFYDSHSLIVQTLSESPLSQYYYLKGLVSIADKHPKRKDDKEVDEEKEQLDNSILDLALNLCQGHNEEEQLVSLMCQFEPDLVYNFLNTHKTYRPHECLKVVLKYNITHAVAYLYEITEQYQDALDLYIIQLNKKVKEMDSELINGDSSVVPPFNESTFPNTVTEKQVKKVLDQAISLCQRNSSQDDALWFKLLDSFVHPLNTIKASSADTGRNRTRRLDTRHIKPYARTSSRLDLDKTDRLRRSLTIFIKNVLESMMGHVDLASIVQKVVKDNGKDKFGDFKSVFMSMLDVTTYQRNILTTTNKLLEDDVYKQSQSLLKTRNKAYSSQNVRLTTRRGAALAETEDAKKQAEKDASALNSERLSNFKWENDQLSKNELFKQVTSGQILKGFAVNSTKPEHIVLSKIFQSTKKSGPRISGKMKPVQSINSLTDSEVALLFGKTG